MSAQSAVTVTWADSGSSFHSRFYNKFLVHAVGAATVSCSKGGSKLLAPSVGLNTLSCVPPCLCAAMLCHRSLLPEITNISPSGSVFNLGAGSRVVK